MATIYFRTGINSKDISFSRFQTIQTSPSVQILLTSGFQAMSIFNQGSGNLLWGSSNIGVNSGNYLYVGARKDWENVQGNWSTYFIADSVSTIITITETK